MAAVLHQALIVGMQARLLALCTAHPPALPHLAHLPWQHIFLFGCSALIFSHLQSVGGTFFSTLLSLLLQDRQLDGFYSLEEDCLAWPAIHMCCLCTSRMRAGPPAGRLLLAGGGLPGQQGRLRGGVPPAAAAGGHPRRQAAPRARLAADLRVW